MALTSRYSFGWPTWFRSCPIDASITSTSGAGQMPTSSTAIASTMSIQNSRALDVRERGDVVVRDLAEHHALDHPQRVGGAQDQRGRREEREPRIGVEGAEDHEELADEARRARQAGVREAEQHHERGELRHRVDDAAVVADLAAVHAVVEHADAEEQRARDEAVRQHLHHAALQRQAARRPSSGAASVAAKITKKPSVTKPMCAIDE